MGVGFLVNLFGRISPSTHEPSATLVRVNVRGPFLMPFGPGLPMLALLYSECPCLVCGSVQSHKDDVKDAATEPVPFSRLFHVNVEFGPV